MAELARELEVAHEELASTNQVEELLHLITAVTGGVLRVQNEDEQNPGTLIDDFYSREVEFAEGQSVEAYVEHTGNPHNPVASARYEYFVDEDVDPIIKTVAIEKDEDGQLQGVLRWRPGGASEELLDVYGLREELDEFGRRFSAREVQDYMQVMEYGVWSLEKPMLAHEADREIANLRRVMGLETAE